MKTIILIFLSTIFLTAQNRIVLNQNGEIQPLSRHKTSRLLNKAPEQIKPFNQLCGVCGTLDTLDYGDNWNVNFGFFGQDIMLQWFEAPTFLNLKTIGFQVTDYNGTELGVKLVSMNWTKEQIQATINDLGATWWGYYPAEGNGYNDATAFPDDLQATGDWIEASETAQSLKWGSPFAESLFDPFEYYTINTDPNDGTDIYWIDVAEAFGFVPEVKKNDLFAVAFKNMSPAMDENRAGFAANNWLDYTGFKYYANGRLQPGVDIGWWTRFYTWDIKVIVDLTGDRGPVIHDFTKLSASMTNKDRLIEAYVTDDNPAGGAAGVGSVKIKYLFEPDTLYSEVLMNGEEPNYSGYIPNVSPYKTLSYFIEATDVLGNITQSKVINYFLYTFSPALFIYDSNYPDLSSVFDLYLADLPPDSTWQNWRYDVWDAYYGPISFEEVQSYLQIYHVMGGGPVNQQTDLGSIYKQWLEQADADNPRHLFISGQDYFWWMQDSTIAENSFERIYLGIDQVTQIDVNYDGTTESVQSPYAINIIDNDPLVGWINDSLYSDSSFIAYDPYYVLNINNWIDNFSVSSGVPIITDPKTGQVIAVRNQGEYWKTTFWAMDPLGIVSINKSDSSSISAAHQHQGVAKTVFEWFGNPITSIEDVTEKQPEQFFLSQNYPNPFNPLTTIEYTVGTNNHSPLHVTLKIYDTLGRLVKTLVDTKQPAGQYKVTFDATELSSGVYYYMLKTDNFSQTRKMVLLK